MFASFPLPKTQVSGRSVRQPVARSDLLTGECPYFDNTDCRGQDLGNNHGPCIPTFYLLKNQRLHIFRVSGR